MKRNIILAIVCIVIVAALVGGCNEWRKVSLLADVQAEDIDKILTYSLDENVMTITDQEGIEKMLDLLQSMELKKPLLLGAEAPDGGLVVELDYNNGDVFHVTLLSGDCMTDEKHYKTAKDYCDDVRDLFEKYSE